MKTFWIVKCFGKHGGLIWEERMTTRENARYMVECCRRMEVSKQARLKYEIEKVSYYS